ncbi:Protein of unknown function [Chryseolinea serpens]|uniref:DUF3307 domain-containing protein n=2 Tax=Chryseolinea serpens TaxID=947013 RepID=A0A1M5N1E1_9BACT|nr:Protein of unknown function [Chryseolinea serpens]
MELFDQDQAIILVKLLTAHILADFVLQRSSWVEEKKAKGLRAWGLYKHIAMVCALTWIAIWDYPVVAVVITITHLIIDYLKIKLDKKGDLSFFIADQLLHILVIIMGWLYVISGWVRMVEVSLSFWTSFNVMLIALGYLFCIGPCSYLIKFSTQDLIQQSSGENVKRGGRLIGIFERIIIYTLVLLNQYEAIGFLITGKSILRFADSQKKETEYVLVGTMLSYALAILMGALVNLLLGR